MRALWWSAAALALLAVAGALRTPQVEGARTGRRFPAQATTDENPSLSKIEDVTKPRLRNSRRREELQPTTPKQVIRSRTRSKPTDTTDNITSKPEVKSRIVNSERYHTRRTYNRTHDRTNENNSNLDSSRDNVIRSRTRYNRPAPTQPTLTTKSTELTSPTIDESKIEVINSTLDEIPKMVFNDEPATTEFKRRSSTVQVSETITPKRIRGRINNRVTEKSGDLASSGTTNSISISEKGPTTDRMIGDLRNARKLRYKSRITDTDTNLTGLGITTSNEVKQSSQNKISPSQVENHSPAPEVVENVVQQSTETNPLKTTTVKVMRIVRRPLQRGKVNFKPTIPLAKKSSDEISDDDNYPESFKALLQAKNVSTQTSSPKSESLSVKASQKIFNTYTTSQQSTFTSPGRNKYSGLRSKHNSGDGSDKILEENFTTTAQPVVISSRQPDFKFRGTFSSRSRKASGFTSSPRPEGLSTDSSTEKPSYKFNRKFKVTTAIPNPDIKLNSKRVETSNLLKRTLNRPTYNSRRNSNRSDVTSTAAPVSSVTGNKLNTIENHSRNKSTLPRTSYYSRQKNVISNNKINPSTEEPSVNNKNVIESAARKNEDNADMPLIFTLLKPTETLEDNNLQGNESNKPIEHKMFVIAVTSKESQETSTEHEMTLNTVEESEGRPVIDISSTPKYHAIYTEPQSTGPEKQEQGNPNTIKPIKNINTRKFGRSKSNQPDEDTSNYNINRERGSGKYTGSYSKTTEASTNGIILEPEKSKNRFSSKYRASYIDKPFYRATVPTVTPSTIEGEEYQLGPDMNAISFTQTRSPDELFKMSESLVKPHVMNVQATHHSPSVTVSIFDALAEILTSTPRNRLSSTTEVLQNQNIISDSKKTPNGVSSSIVVKSVGDFSNQDTFVLANVNVNTKAKPVQTTDQFTQNVNNLSSVEENVTPSLSTQERVLASLTTSQPLPTPIPTTPISARKPFAIKFLYSDTEKPTDQLMTASEPTSNQPSTDNPKMVYNTVSDLLLSNNNVVSSELTSMLSSNINSILRNMNESTRSKLSADMAKLLKNLIPRAIDGLMTVADNVDFIPNTTPYSLEEIRDTENVNFDSNFKLDNDSVISDLIQNVGLTNNVNNTIWNVNKITEDAPTSLVEVVNNPEALLDTNTVTSTSESRTTVADTKSNTSTESTIFSPMSTLSTTNDDIISTSIASLDDLPGDSNNERVNSFLNNNNNKIPLPFFTNSQIDDFVNSNFNVTQNRLAVPQLQPLPYHLQPVPNNDDSNIQDIHDITPLQLWVLSKKAKVLKIIEDLLRDHNKELANATALTEMFQQSNGMPFSERLTEIMSTMNSTTEFPNKDNNLFSTTTPSSFPILLASSTSPSNGNSEDEQTVMSITTNMATPANEMLATASTQLSTDTITTTLMSNLSEMDFTTIPTTSEVTVDVSNRLFGESEETSTETITTQSSIVMDIETTTQEYIDATTQNGLETTTQSDSDTTTSASTSKNPVFSTSNQPNTVQTIPKKDYVIFGILPNNTVVRKNPNDDILESLTEASPYIVYGVLPNNTIIRKFPNGTRVPRVMQKIDVLPISPWSLRNPYSPIHNNPAIVRPQSNPIRVSTNVETSTITSNNGTENRLTTTDTVNNLQNMTKQIRTEKPSDGSDGAVFKYIPIDEVTVSSQNSNVLKLASSKSPTTEMSQTQVMSVTTVTETNTQTPQIPTLPITDDPTTTVQITAGTSIETSSETVTMQSPLAKTSTEIIDTTPVTSFTATSQTSITATTEIMSTTLKPETTVSVTTESTTFTSASTSEAETKMTPLSTTMSYSTDGVTKEESKSYEEDAKLLQALLAGTERNPKNINFDVPDQKIGTSAVNTKTASIKLSQPTEEEKLLQALLSAVGNNQGTASLPKDSNNKVSTKTPTTTTRSIEDDIRQFEEDTKLLKALLQATGQNPANFNIPTIDNLQKNAIFTSTIASTTEITTTPQTTESTKLPTTTRATDTNTKQRLADDAILQALLQATNQNNGNYDIPVISGITSNVRISSNPRTTSLGSSPTTPINVRPIYTTISTSPKPILSTFTVPTTLQPRVPVATATENVRISTTFAPFNQRGRTQTTTPVESTTAATGRQVPSSPSTITTELPSSSTYSVEEDLAFLQNLKSVLNTNANPSDPESALANRIIALAVDRSLNEIKSGDPTKRNGKNIIPTTTTSSTTTTTTTTTTTPRPKEPTSSTPSIEDDIRQFQEDSKLLQALLKATGQDPSKYNIPSLPNIDTKVSPQLRPEVNSDLNLLSNLLASPSPLNEPFDSLTQKPQTNIPMVSKTVSTTPKPFGAKIAVKDDLKSVQDDAKLLQTLIQLQGAQETTTLKSKIAVTGQSTDEALKKLIQQTKPTGMVPEATKMPLAISTEYGKSNDALLAALLKEQGFGPTTASSLDEQLRLAIPLDPPRAVTSEQTPGRGQLVSAAINVTRAFSQFLGAAIQGAAQTVQNVIRAGQRAATDVYSNGSGASG